MPELGPSTNTPAVAVYGRQSTQKTDISHNNKQPQKIVYINRIAVLCRTQEEANAILLALHTARQLF